jgi:hypothetical protein
MSTFYLMDMHVPVIANSRIVDVIMTTSPTEEIRVDGLTPIKIPEGVRVLNPANLPDLLAQKYAGILAQYPGFTKILFDDLLDPSGVQIAGPPSNFRKSGSRSTIGGNFRTVATAALSTISECVFVCEHYTWKYVDSKNSRIERYYIEEPETLHTSQVSVNGGTTFATTTSGNAITLLVGDQGSSVVIEFLSNLSSNLSVNNRLVHTGSWAVIY